MKNTILKNIALAGILAIGLSSCGGSGNGTDANSDADKQVLGAGSTFGNPIYTKMFSDYGKTSGMQTNYQSIGSGGGIKQLMNKISLFWFRPIRYFYLRLL